METIKTLGRYFLIALWIQIVFSGCSAQYRFKRLIRKHPDLIEKNSITDTIIHAIKGETAAFPLKMQKDTTINGIGFFPKIENQDSVLFVECPTDTIYCEDKFIEYRIRDPTFMDWVDPLKGYILAAVFLAIIFLRK